MKNPTVKILEAALASYREGTPIKSILVETGLNYSQAWLYIRTAECKEAGLMVEEVNGSAIAELRASGFSWGEIAVRCQLPESRVRKMFTENSGQRSQGLRIGKGGRFFYDEGGAPLYTDELKATGTIIPEGALYEGAIAASVEQRLIHRDVNELRAMAEEAGVKFSKSSTKAVLAKRLRDAGVA